MLAIAEFEIPIIVVSNMQISVAFTFTLFSDLLVGCQIVKSWFCHAVEFGVVAGVVRFHSCRTLKVFKVCQIRASRFAKTNAFVV